MKNAKFSAAQIIAILRRAQRTVCLVSEQRHEHGMSSNSFYKWRARFGGMDASMMPEMKVMAGANRPFKRGVHLHKGRPESQNDINRDAPPARVAAMVSHGVFLRGTH